MANNQKRIETKFDEIRYFRLCIEKAAPVPIYSFIPKEFSLAYNNRQD